MVDLNFKYKSAIDYFKKISPFTPEIAIILGSGLGDFANSTKKDKTISSTEIPNYPSSSIEGHQGLIHFSTNEKKKILIFQGRIHFYEGYSLSDCVLPVLLAKKSGCKKIIFTNAAGGVNKKFKPGDLMLVDSFNSLNIKMELTNLLGISSLENKNNFLDCPSARMNKLFKKTAEEYGIPLQTGVYFFTKGPNYETPAEIEMIKRFAGDAVGMSTVHEAVYASCQNLEVAMISCITNLAAGISGEKLSHSEVTQIAKKSADKFTLLLQKAISRI